MEARIVPTDRDLVGGLVDQISHYGVMKGAIH